MRSRSDAQRPANERGGPIGDSVRANLPAIFRHRSFTLYLSGVALTQIGTNGTFAAMLYHVYTITGSTVQVGLVGASRGLATVLLSPLGGHYADRVDRKRLLQVSQAFSMLVSLALAAVTISGSVNTAQIMGAALLTSAAATFDSSARKAIIPGMVPRAELVQAVALVNPTNQVGKLVGPSLGGLLIAVGGPELMYLLDAFTYVALIVILGLLTVPALDLRGRDLRFWASLKEGIAYVRDRPVIYQLMGLDLSATLFAAYRVVLPALAVDVLGVGPTGYGLLSAAVPAGALIGGVVVYRLARSAVPAGHAVLAATASYGFAAILLAHAGSFSVALIAAAGLGVFDAIGTTIRHAAVLLETPDELRGRVSAIYGMASRGGPAIGDMNIGWLSGILGATAALTLGGMVPIALAGLLAVSSKTVRAYRTTPVAEAGSA
jgi:MFS family permease